MLVKYFVRPKISFYKKNIFKVKSGDIYQFIFIATYILFLFHSGGIYQTKLIPTVLLILLPVIFLPLVIFFTKRSFYLLFFLALVLRLLMIFASPNPKIDVYTMLKEAPTVLLQGINPYQAVFSSVYSGVTADYFTYWPLSFLIQIPFVLIFHDPRVLLIVADISAAWLLFLISNRSNSGQLLTLIYLFRPNTNFIIEQSFLTPMEFLFFISIVFFLKYRENNSGISSKFFPGIFAGLLSAVKPHYAFLLFLLFKKNFRQTAAGFLLPIIFLVSPFFFWNQKAFVSDTAGYFLKPAAELFYVPINLSLNINSLINVLTGKTIPYLYTIFILILIWGALYYIFTKNFNFIIQNNGNKFREDFVLASIIFLLTFYLTQRFAFINYYYFTGSLIILWLILNLQGVKR